MAGRSPESDFDALERHKERCKDAEELLALLIEVFGEEAAANAVNDAFEQMFKHSPTRAESAIHKWADRFWR